MFTIYVYVEGVGDAVLGGSVFCVVILFVVVVVFGFEELLEEPPAALLLDEWLEELPAALPLDALLEDSVLTGFVCAVVAVFVVADGRGAVVAVAGSVVIV